MMSLNEVQLGQKAALYVAEKLSLGKTLSRLLLNSHEISNGRISTKLPPGIDEREAHDFESGGKLPLGHNRARPLGDLEPVPNTNDAFVDEIRAFLDANNSRVCIFEDASAQPNDQFLRAITTRALTYDDEVYHLVCARDSHEQMLKTIHAARSWLFVGALTQVPDATGLCSKKTLTRDEIENLAQNAIGIVVGAYDGEGFVVWTKEGHHL